jgi:uncharacterized protein DUF6184
VRGLARHGRGDVSGQRQASACPRVPIGLLGTKPSWNMMMKCETLLIMRVGASLWACFAVGALSGLACDRTRQEKSLLSEPVDKAELRPASGVGLPAGAALRIAQARCVREQRCNNIGQGHEYASRPDCEERIQAKWRQDLNLIRCPSGVDEGALSACLREIRDTDCNDVIDTFGRWVACAASKICDAGR